MRKRGRRVVGWGAAWAAALVLGAASCRRAVPSVPAWTPDLAAFSGEHALAEATALAQIVPRVAGQPGTARAAAHVAERFRAVGLAPTVDAFVDWTPEGTGTFRNVVAERAGTGPGMVVLVAHYDAKGGIADDFMGADDGGSGVGELLELARVLAAGAPPPWTVRFVAVDGEECAVEYGPHDGLHGSRHEAAALRRSGRAADVRAVILFDMVGDRDLTLTLPRNGDPALLQRAFDAARAEGIRDRVSLLGSGMLDDHVPFLDLGMPAVDLIDFQFGSAPGLNDYWHTRADTPDKLSAASLAHVGRLALRMLAATPESGAAAQP